MLNGYCALNFFQSPLIPTQQDNLLTSPINVFRSDLRAYPCSKIMRVAVNFISLVYRGDDDLHVGEGLSAIH
jgi:hypothetical protein